MAFFNNFISNDSIGITIYRNGDQHTGDYFDGVPKGRGVIELVIKVETKKLAKTFLPQIRYANGDVFEGFFKNGLQHGAGSLRYENGSKRDGTWKEGKLNGFVFYHISDESSPTVERWVNGVQFTKKSPNNIETKET